MKCPSCGYVSFDRVEACKGCGAPLAATAVPTPPARIGNPGAPPSPPESKGGQLELCLEPGRPASARPDQGRKRRPRQKGRDKGAAPIGRLHDDTPDLWQARLIPRPAAGAGADQPIFVPGTAADQFGQ